MKQVKWVERSLIDSPLCIGLCLSESAFRRELRKLDVPKKSWPVWVSESADACVHYMENPSSGAKCCIVCVSGDTDRNRSEVIGLLVHEAVHVWQAVLEDINEDTPSTEFEAYAIQNISQRLIEAWQKMGAKKKGKKTKGGSCK
jgi:hypothetical protein